MKSKIKRIDKELAQIIEKMSKQLDISERLVSRKLAEEIKKAGKGEIRF